MTIPSRGSAPPITAPEQLPPYHFAVPLDGNRLARGQALKTAVDRLYAAMLELEDRPRKRSPSIAEQDRRALDAVVCDLFWEARVGRGRWSSYSTGNRPSPYDRTRYEVPVLARRRRLKGVIGYLASRGFVTTVKGKMKPDNRTGGIGFEPVASKVRATPQLLWFLEKFSGATPYDIGDGPIETIELRAPKPGWGKTGAPIEYVDNVETVQMRSDMAIINSFIARRTSSYLMSDLTMTWRTPTAAPE